MAWAKSHATPIIEDDFDSIVEPPAQGLKALKSLDTRGVCIYIADLSRVLMPGVAISYAIAPRAIVEAYRAARVLQVSTPTAGEQLAFAAFLTSNEFSRQITRMRAVYAERRDVLATELVTQLGGAILSVERRGPLQVIARLAGEFRDVAIAEAAAALDLEIVPLSAVAPDEQGLILGYGGTSADGIRTAVSILAEAIALSRRQTVGASIATSS
jgi:GntR family transcriptional regulator/MocR family aminotransferase